jgi:hypothetical protein
MARSGYCEWPRNARRRSVRDGTEAPVTAAALLPVAALDGAEYFQRRVRPILSKTASAATTTNWTTAGFCFEIRDSLITDRPEHGPAVVPANRKRARWRGRSGITTKSSRMDPDGGAVWEERELTLGRQDRRRSGSVFWEAIPLRPALRRVRRRCPEGSLPTRPRR